MYLIFDYDGTLHDTALIYCKAINRTFLKLSGQGIKVPPEITVEEAAGWLGYSSYDAWEDMVPGLSEELKEQAVRETGKEMGLLIREGKSRLYPGVPEMLETLKSEGHHLFILSNCTVDYIENHRRAFGLDRFIEGYYPAEKYGFMPKTEIFGYIKDYCTNKYGPVNPGEIAVIGDRYHDIEAGNVNGAHTVGCLYGSGSPEELESAEWKIKSPEELIPLAEALFSRLRFLT